MFVLYIISFYAFIVFTKSDTVISTHASAREATPNGTFPIATSKFQSTLPRGKRHGLLTASRRFGHFNPRFREGSDILGHHWWHQGNYFNPRFREGSDQMTSHHRLLRRISIHASAREATLTLAGVPRISFYFNPRFREGSDVCIRLSLLFPPISIHASAREATGLATIVSV